MLMHMAEKLFFASTMIWSMYVIGCVFAVIVFG